MTIQDIINAFKSGVNPSTELGVGGIDGKYFFFFVDPSIHEDEVLFNVQLTGNFGDDYVEVEGDTGSSSRLLICTYWIYSDGRTEFKSIKLDTPATCSIDLAISEVKSWYSSTPKDWKFHELIKA